MSQESTEHTASPEPLSAVEERLHGLGALPLARRLADNAGVKLSLVLSRKCRWARVVLVRHRLWMIIKHTLDLDWKEMERIFLFDHTTIIAGVAKSERELHGEPVKCA